MITTTDDLFAEKTQRATSWFKRICGKMLGGNVDFPSFGNAFSCKTLMTSFCMLLLAACSGFEEGDEVVVLSDYDDYRPGYISGKYVSSKDGKIDVEIKKFHNVSASLFDGLERGDEESFLESTVYSKEDGKKIIDARKHFFKEIDKIEISMKNLRYLAQMTGRSIYSNKVLQKVKSINASKIKLNENRIEKLEALAITGKLGDWLKVTPIMKLLVELETQMAKGFDERMEKINATQEKFEVLRKELTETFQRMPYSTGEHSNNSHMLAFIFSLKAIIMFPQFAGIKYDLINPDDINDFRKKLEITLAINSYSIKENINWLAMIRSYSEVIANGSKDRVENRDPKDEERRIRLWIAKEYLRKGVKLSLFKKGYEKGIVKINANLGKLGVSGDDLDKGFDNHLKKLFAKYTQVKVLSESSWQGTLRYPISAWPREFKTMNVKLIPIILEVRGANKLEMFVFAGKGKIERTDGNTLSLELYGSARATDFQLNISNKKTPVGGGSGRYTCSLDEYLHTIACIRGWDKQALLLKKGNKDTERVSESEPA